MNAVKFYVVAGSAVDYELFLKTLVNRELLQVVCKQKQVFIKSPVQLRGLDSDSIVFVLHDAEDREDWNEIRTRLFAMSPRLNIYWNISPIISRVSFIKALSKEDLHQFLY